MEMPGWQVSELSRGVEMLADIYAAREIQSQILKDFSARSELSDWFGRVGLAETPAA